MLDKLSSGKMEKAMQLMQNPTEAEETQAVAQILATIEYRQLTAVEELHDNLDMDGFESMQSVEARQQQLLDLAEALTPGGDFEAYWFDEVAGEFVENPDRAKAYAGLDADEWERQKERWADTYRDRGADGSTDELAGEHVRRRFGVTLDEFQENVVEWSAQEALENLLAHNFKTAEHGIYAAAERAEELTADQDDSEDESTDSA